LDGRLPPDIYDWLLAAARVLASGLVPLVLWSLYGAVARSSGYEQRWFLLVGGGLLAWMRYAFAVRAIRELVLMPLLPISPENGAYLYRGARWLLLYAVLQWALVEGMWNLGIADDFVLLIGSVLQLSLVAAVSLFLVRKRAVMELFPQTANRPYQRFVRTLD